MRPLLKKPGLAFIEQNYHPVSNLNFISKIVERCILQQFNRHCKNYNLLPEYQSSYRTNHNCETSLLKIVKDLLWGIKRHSVTAFVAMYLSAAFDTADHEVLINVLKTKFGINVSALNWFSTYLRPRCVQSQIGDKCSSNKNLTFSIPQDSFAGTKVFTVCSSTFIRFNTISAIPKWVCW